MTNHETDLTNNQDNQISLLDRLKHQSFKLGATALATLGFSTGIAAYVGSTQAEAKNQALINTALLPSAFELNQVFLDTFGSKRSGGYSISGSEGFQGMLISITYLHLQPNFYEAKGPCQYPSPDPEANSTVFIKGTLAGVREILCGNIKGFSGDFYHSRKEINNPKTWNSKKPVSELSGWLRNSGLFQPVLNALGNTAAESIAEATGVRSVPHGKADNYTLTSPSGTSPDWHVVVDFANTENDNSTNPPLRSYTASGHGNTITSYNIRYW